MTFEELVHKILEICPLAVFEERNGEVIVATGWLETGGPGVPMAPIQD